MAIADRPRAATYRRLAGERRMRTHRGDRRALLMRGLLSLLAVLVAAAFVLPAAWMLFGSLEPGSDVIGNVSPLSWYTLIPKIWTLDNYRELFGDLGFARPVINSLVVAGVSVLVGLGLSAPAAYALAVLQFRGREVVFALLVVGFMVPFEAVAIPLVQVFTSWHLQDTYLSLILPGVGNGLAIFYLRQAFLGMPSSLREAAIIDGASDFHILTRIFVRLNGTAMINSGLLIFMAQWLAYLWPLLIVSSDQKQVAAVALSRTFTDASFNFGQLFGAALVISAIPAIALLTVQRHFTLSVAESGEKG